MQELWLARDSHNALFLYKEKPVKYPTIWVCSLTTPRPLLELDSSLFPEVKWSDKEPTKVKLVIDK